MKNLPYYVKAPIYALIIIGICWIAENVALFVGVSPREPIGFIWAIGVFYTIVFILIGVIAINIITGIIKVIK